MASRVTVRTTQTPIGVTELEVLGLGKVKGLLYANGVRQFLGIPYASLKKRWTRSALRDSWPDGYHDGRDLGYGSYQSYHYCRTLNKRRSQAPNPLEYRETGILTPIDTFAHLTEPIEDEASCLILNITIPPADTDKLGSLPVMFYIHGGS